jgi:hypothetical protein
MTHPLERLTECMNDRRMSRAYEACLILIGDKIIASKNETNSSENNDDDVKKLKKCLTNLADYLCENFQTILETEEGVFALRAFLRVIGAADPLENVVAPRVANKKFPVEFNVKNLTVKQVPAEWKLNKYIKKFAKHLSGINVLEIGLVPSVSPCISLLLRKLYTTYADDSVSILESIHEQFVKKPNSFHSMIQDSIGSRFIESFLYTCPIDILTEFYLEQHLIPKIVLYSKHIYANYPIQALIKHRLDKDSKVNKNDCLLLL